MRDFDNRKPSKIETDFFKSSIDLRATEFLRTFGTTIVEITDYCANPVEKSKITDLAFWWNIEESFDLDNARKNSHVVHLPIPEEALNITPFSALKHVDTMLSSGDPALISLFDTYPNHRVPVFCWMILGPSGLEVAPHRDMFSTASWNLLYSGRKTWRFWKPSQKYTNGARPFIQFEQTAGDLIWIPEGWWHSVSYQEASICLSKNLVLRRTLSLVKKELKLRDKYLYNILLTILLIEKRKLNV